jgi:hypothetical protein
MAGFHREAACSSGKVEADAIQQVHLTSAYLPNPHPFRWHYILAAIASLALSAWGAYAVSIPNPDSVLYLSAADQFAAGHWAQGLAIYKWPTYSLLIAAVMMVTGLQAFLAAQVVNTFLALGTTLGFISLARALSNGDRAVVTVAAIMIALHPQLTELRPWIIRDNGYLCFFVIAIYYAVADNIAPSPWRKLALVGALVAATLFRVEGLYLALLVLIYYVLVRLKSVTAQVSTIIVFVVAITALLPVAYQIWVTGTLGKWMSGNGLDINMALFAGPIEKRVDFLETYVLFQGSGPKWEAYISLVIGLSILAAVRALTPIYTIFGLFAFLPNRLIPARALLPIAWFAAGQLPMFFLFTFIQAFLTWRYAMGFALIAMFAAVFCITTSWRELLMGRPRAFFVFPTFVVLALGGFAFDIPRPSNLSHLREAASWVETHVPESADLWMNDPRIAYFSGRNLHNVAGINRIFGYPPPAFAEAKKLDVLVLVSGKKFHSLQIPVPLAKLRLAASFQAGDSDVVRVFIACPEMTGCTAKP